MTRAALLSALILGGCATAPPRGSQSPEGDWQLVSIGGEPAVGEGTVHFDAPGGGYRGQAPCNHFSETTYRLEDAHIVAAGNGLLTTAACRDQRRQQRERVFVQEVLWKKPHFRIDGDRMLLTGPRGDVVELRRTPK